MPPATRSTKPRAVGCRFGIIGLGAFGRFMGGHLARHGQTLGYDPSAQSRKAARAAGISCVPLEEAAAADIVILAVPVDRMAVTCRALAPHLARGALVLDVGSVKLKPAGDMLKNLPAGVEIICTHPLFGPQSARDGLKGHNIAVANVRGKSLGRVRRFLAQTLGLNVIVTTADEHDRELAAVQGLTHMIARILVQMEPLPKKMTTRSFELIMGAVEMVRYDSEELFMAIEKQNPYSRRVRERFFRLASELDRRLAGK